MSKTYMTIKMMITDDTKQKKMKEIQINVIALNQLTKIRTTTNHMFNDDVCQYTYNRCRVLTFRLSLY